MSDKYPDESPYTYCGNNPILLIDPNGREKIISFNTSNSSEEQNTTNSHLKDAANHFPNNDNVIHLFAHGVVTNSGKCIGISIYNSNEERNERISTTFELDKFLKENSMVYQNSNAKTVILVMHSCKTGQDNAIAQQASLDLNMLIIAPSDMVNVYTAVFSPEIEYSKETGVSNEGCWEVYYKGIKIDSISGSTPPVFDNPDQVINEYEKAYRQIQGCETATD